MLLWLSVSDLKPTGGINTENLTNEKSLPGTFKGNTPQTGPFLRGRKTFPGTKFRPWFLRWEHNKVLKRFWGNVLTV